MAISRSQCRSAAARVEWPTLAVALAIYAGLGALTWYHALVPGWLLPLLGSPMGRTMEPYSLISFIIFMAIPAMPWGLREGSLAVPREPGLGVELDPIALDRLHRRYLECGISGRDDEAEMRKIEPGWTFRSPRW